MRSRTSSYTEPGNELSGMMLLLCAEEGSIVHVVHYAGALFGGRSPVQS